MSKLQLVTTVMVLLGIFCWSILPLSHHNPVFQDPIVPSLSLALWVPFLYFSPRYPEFIFNLLELRVAIDPKKYEPVDLKKQFRVELKYALCNLIVGIGLALYSHPHKWVCIFASMSVWIGRFAYYAVSFFPRGKK